MEGKGPYRIYDPGGNSTNPPKHPAFKVFPKDNAALMGSMEDIRSLGDLLEESQNEVHKLRQKAEALVQENNYLKVSSHLDPHCAPTERATQSRQIRSEEEQLDDFFDVQVETMKPEETLTPPKGSNKTPPSGTSSEFEILNGFEKKTLECRKSDPGPSMQPEDDTLRFHLQRLENSFSMFAEDPDRNQVVKHMSRMALEFNRLASKVHKNELRTSVLQTLCEQLRKENEDLRAKLEADWNQRAQAEQTLRLENLEMKKLILERGSARGNQSASATDSTSVENQPKVENAGILQVSKPASKDPLVALLKKVKVLEHQRAELLEVNKQWDQQFRSMKIQYEEKITSLRQKLSKNIKAESEQEVERDRKQRDFDRKLLLARDKIEEKEAFAQKLESELRDLKQKNKFLHDQLSSISKQREYQEREISRLNKALEEALNLHGPPSFTLSTEDLPPRQELLIQNDILKQQVKIFEEDFQKERSDRERMNEEKEELKRQLEQLENQLGQVTSQLRTCQDDLRKAKESPHELPRQQATSERYLVDPVTGPVCPPYPYSPPGIIYPGYDDWHIHYPPPIISSDHSQLQDVPNVPPPAYQWRAPNILARSQHHKGSKKKETDVPAGASQRPT
ncbi:TNFAIP3-interacting protein 1 [Pelobates fuscus]|uniref:TNFAIP3-interacting protein 1 n=1 Tax=Pelobates fuscus TaxID=191477 RepID=UPI002FE47A55